MAGMMFHFRRPIRQTPRSMDSVGPIAMLQGTSLESSTHRVSPPIWDKVELEASRQTDSCATGPLAQTDRLQHLRRLRLADELAGAGTDCGDKLKPRRSSSWREGIRSVRQSSRLQSQRMLTDAISAQRANSRFKIRVTTAMVIVASPAGRTEDVGSTTVAKIKSSSPYGRGPWHRENRNRRRKSLRKLLHWCPGKRQIGKTAKIGWRTAYKTPEARQDAEILQMRKILQTQETTLETLINGTKLYIQRTFF
ncbi:hypothetical protein C8R43DRAFT_942919 [Mycena crocata]|nr:hypothetical protein C8R43DRAFT_942919 [Mycena crocata]